MDAGHVLQLASDMELAQPSRERAYQPVSIQRLDETLIDTLFRLVKLVDEPALVPRLAPLAQQEILIRLLSGPYRPQLQRLVAAGSPASRSRRPSRGSNKISLRRCASTTWQTART